MGRRRDDDEFIPHNAGLSDGNGRAARDLYPILYAHGDGNPRSVVHDLLHLPDGNAREEHLRLRIQPNGTPEACIEHIVLPAAKAQPSKEHNHGDEECDSPERKRPNLCLSTHAPASLRWCSVRKNA